jgi:hypothetical protein
MTTKFEGCLKCFDLSFIGIELVPECPSHVGIIGSYGYLTPKKKDSNEKEEEGETTTGEATL